ncbi:MAG TPA: zinc metallopeptidase [Candidatus Acidoferrales bacterium]|nr:zinc metallopeptidase [Candidatus Acidoferrales bacterium]
MPFFFGFDPTFVLLLPAMAFALWAQWKVRSTYQKFAQVPAANGMTGEAMARAIMQRNGVTDVRIEEIGGQLSDHYDPGAHTVRLSPDIYEGHSIAAIAVAAHEVGHVLQHHRGYVPLSLRASFAPVAGIGSSLAMPLFFIGLLFSRSMPFSGVLMDLGIVFFAGAVLFHFVTLPVEFDASRRALAQLTESGAVMPQEVAGAKKVLDAAALTYVAAAAMAALQLMRLVLLRGNRR